MKSSIYADHAASTSLSQAAFEAMKPWFCEQFANPSALYSMARRPKKAICQARGQIAACIGAQPDEIFFTSGGTESNNWVLKTIAEHGRIITSAFEHPSVLNVCRSLEKCGHDVTEVPVSSTGFVDAAAYREAVQRGSRGDISSVMMVNNEIGTIQPIRGLADIAHQNDMWFHTDAVQAVGHIEVDVNELNVDMLSSSAHKFNGPKGIGFIYIRRGVPIPPWIEGGGQENGMRSGTENVASIVGMAAALKENCDRMQLNQEYLNLLCDIILNDIKNSDLDYRINGAEPRVPGLISLSFRGISGESVLHQMDLHKIAISTGSACHARDAELSHVIRAISVPSLYAHGTVRISLGPENTEDEMHLLSKTLIQCVKNCAVSSC